MKKLLLLSLSPLVCCSALALTLGDVKPGSAFESFGLRPGDKIVSINGKKTNLFSSAKKTAETLEKSDNVEIIFVRDGVRKKSTRSIKNK